MTKLFLYFVGGFLSVLAVNAPFDRTLRLALVTVGILALIVAPYA